MEVLPICAESCLYVVQILRVCVLALESINIDVFDRLSLLEI